MLGGIFLIPNGTFIVEVLIFVVALGIVAKFILPPIKNVMDERSETIRSAALASNEGHAEADRLAAEGRHVLELARADARRILEESSQQVADMIEAARARAQVEHDRQMAEAATRLEAERARLRDESIARLGDLVVAAASQIVGSPIDNAKHRALIAGTVAEARAKSEA